MSHVNTDVPIQYQIIEQKMPKVTELHGEKVKYKSSITEKIESI